MHHSARARMEFDAADPLVLGQMRRDREVAIHVRAAGRQLVAGGHLKDEVWRPEVPPVGKRRQRRHSVWIALRHALRHPRRDGLDLRVGQTALVGELPVAVGRMPRRHVARAGDFRDQLAPLPGVLVRDERKRRRFSRPVARDTVRVKNWRDALAERHRGSPGPQRLSAEEDRRREDGYEKNGPYTRHNHFLRLGEETMKQPMEAVSDAATGLPARTASSASRKS